MRLHQWTTRTGSGQQVDLLRKNLKYMMKKTKNISIEVQGTSVSILSGKEGDYISLTDMLKAKDGEFFISDWLRNPSIERTLARHAPLPYTSWWLDQAPSRFVGEEA